MESVNNPWHSILTQAELQERADGIMENLNREYNKHGIYLIAEDGSCAVGTSYDPITYTSSTYSSSDLDEDVIDIFDYGNDGGENCQLYNDNTICGDAFGAPGRYFEIRGSYFDQNLGVVVPVGRTPTTVHELGHNLGLLHTYTGTGVTDGCDDQTGTCPNDAPAGTDLCRCCGDNVCDTEATPCPLNANMSEAQLRNYMNCALANGEILYTDRFTLGQVKRMRAYLALSNTLASVIEPNGVVHSGTLPSGTYTDIIVESGTELEITSPIEMLPGASITVETNALLRVKSTITGACGQMWRGIIVEGDANLPQTPANQGKVVVHSNGVIEHAVVGIEVQEIDTDGNPQELTGGGIVEVLVGTLRNNTIGIRFGQYSALGAANISNLLFGDFSVDDDYRGEEKPVLVQADGVVKLKVKHCSFGDKRTTCSEPNDRAWGIVLNSSGMRGWGGSFDNLGVGIWADEISVSSGSMSIQWADFTDCYTGVLAHSTSSFRVKNNEFFLGRPSGCPEQAGQIVGSRLEGSMTGFSFDENTFTYPGEKLPMETLIGTHALGMGEGMNNTIFRNTYQNMFIGNFAEGFNGVEEGLLYLCNTSTYDLQGGGFPFDYQIADGATVKNTQAGIDDQGDFLPTGNIFSDFGSRFWNDPNNADIDYYYFDGEPLQNPNPGSEGINPEDVNQPNESCSPEFPPDPCEYPCSDGGVVDGWKQDFFQHKQEWQNRVANLPNISDSLLVEAEKDTILSHRLAMNQNASRVLKQYSLDTTVIQVDSILTWLNLSESYSADLRLAKHYFFTKDFTSFDALWSQLPTKHGLSGDQLDEYNELELVYDLVQPHLQSGGMLYDISQATLDSLKFWGTWCSEPGFLSQSLLFRNGTFISSDCLKGVVQRVAFGNGMESSVPQNPEFKVFPNPADQELVIDFGTELAEAEVLIFNLQGNLVLDRDFQLPPDKTTLDLGNLPSGIYFLQIRTAKSDSFQTKFLIQH